MKKYAVRGSFTLYAFCGGAVFTYSPQNTSLFTSISAKRSRSSWTESNVYPDATPPPVPFETASFGKSMPPWMNEPDWMRLFCIRRNPVWSATSNPYGRSVLNRYGDVSGKNAASPPAVMSPFVNEYAARR